jgi:hypothetical protein
MIPPGAVSLPLEGEGFGAARLRRRIWLECGQNHRNPTRSMNTNPQRAVVLVLLLSLMAVTRSYLLYHFAPVPDASWGAFFIAGFYLRDWTKWAFPLFMAVAMGVDYASITAQGIDFWSHYCVSPGYWFLIPAYLALWLGGSYARRVHSEAHPARSLAAVAGSLAVSVVVCHLFAQGGFYWLSDSVPQPATLAGWWKNYSDWLLPYLRTAAIYTGLAAIAHVGAQQAARLAKPQRKTV